MVRIKIVKRRNYFCKSSFTYICVARKKKIEKILQPVGYQPNFGPSNLSHKFLTQLLLRLCLFGTNSETLKSRFMPAFKNRFPFADRIFQTQDVQKTFGPIFILIPYHFKLLSRRTKVAYFRHSSSVVVGES